jgi:hypothetical protein
VKVFEYQFIYVDNQFLETEMTCVNHLEFLYAQNQLLQTEITYVFLI